MTKQLDGQLTKVMDFLETVRGYNHNVEYIQKLDMCQDLTPVLSQSEVYGLSERVKTLREHIETV